MSQPSASAWRAAAHRVVVRAGYTLDLRAIGGDGIDPLLADGGMHGNHAATMKSAGTPGDGAPMVAVGGTGNRDRIRRRTVAAGGEIGGGRGFRNARTGQVVA